MEFEIYNIAGISITLGKSHGDCPVGFTPPVCACVCVRVVNRDRDFTVRHSRSI